MDRLILTLAIVAFFALCLWGMWRGWRRKAREQSARIPPFPRTPENPGEPTLPETTGLYLATTTAGQWQDRIVTRQAGLRGKVVLRLYAGGVDVDRHGAPGFWIPADTITAVRRDKQIAGKVMGVDNLLIITWKAGEVVLDTGFRGDDLDVYPQWIDAVSAMAGQGATDEHDLENHTGDSLGGAQ